MGMDPATIGIIGGFGVNALSSLLGANSQSSANAANLQYTMAHNQMMQQAVAKMMQPGANPYSQALMSFMGQGVPGTYGSTVDGSSPGPGGYNPGDGGGGGGGGGGGSSPLQPSYNLAGSPYSYGAAGAGAAAAAGPTGIPWQDNPGMTLGQLLQGANSGDPAYAKYLSGGAYGGGYQAGYGGGFYGGMKLPVDINSLPLGTTLGDLVKNGTISQADAYKMFNYDPTTDNPDYGKTLLGTNLTAISPTNQSQWSQAQQAMTNSAQAANQAWMANFNAMNAPDVARYLTNGVVRNGAGQAVGANDPYYNTGGLPPTTTGGMQGGGGVGGGQPQVGAYNGTNMYGYQPINAATYNPATLGNAPLVNAAQVGSPGRIDPYMLSAQSVQAPGPIGTSFYNNGQDALMQTLRGAPSLGLDQIAQGALTRTATNPAQFQGSDAASAFTNLANINLNQQLDQLHASAGDLGKRFGTGMMNSEALLRTNSLANLNATLAPLYQQGFESAQQRGLSAAGQLSQNALGLGGLQGSIYGTQVGGAGQLAGVGNTMAGLSLQAQQSNASNQLQAALANAGYGMQAGQLNAGQSLAAQQTNAANQLQLGGMNLGAAMQAALANQGLLGQYGMANANLLNQASQYNTTNMNQMAQFNAQQGSLYNQFMLGGINQAAGLQNTQNQYNAGLLGLLAGLPIPQQQVSPYPAAFGNLGATIGMIPFMNQVLQQPQMGYGTNLLNGYTPGMYSGFTPRPM